jgi:hypothetical protein
MFTLEKKEGYDSLKKKSFTLALWFYLSVDVLIKAEPQSTHKCGLSPVK